MQEVLHRRHADGAPEALEEAIALGESQLQAGPADADAKKRQHALCLALGHRLRSVPQHDVERAATLYTRAAEIDPACPVARLCPSFGTGPTDPIEAEKLVTTQGPA